MAKVYLGEFKRSVRGAAKGMNWTDNPRSWIGQNGIWPHPRLVVRLIHLGDHVRLRGPSQSTSMGLVQPGRRFDVTVKGAALRDWVNSLEGGKFDIVTVELRPKQRGLRPKERRLMLKFGNCTATFIAEECHD